MDGKPAHEIDAKTEKNHRNTLSRKYLPAFVYHLFLPLYQKKCVSFMALQWRHNDRDGVSNHQPHDCLLNRLFRCRSKEASKLRVTSLCLGNSPGAGEFPAQRASNAENASIWWRHHECASCIDIFDCNPDNAKFHAVTFDHWPSYPIIAHELRGNINFLHDQISTFRIYENITLELKVYTYLQKYRVTSLIKSSMHGPTENQSHGWLSQLHDIKS